SQQNWDPGRVFGLCQSETTAAELNDCCMKRYSVNMRTLCGIESNEPHGVNDAVQCVFAEGDLIRYGVAHGANTKSRSVASKRIGPAKEKSPPKRAIQVNDFKFSRRYERHLSDGAYTLRKEHQSTFRPARLDGRF